MLVLLFSSFIILSTYPNYSIEILLISPLIFFGLGLDAITIKSKNSNISNIQENDTQIVIHPNVGLHSSMYTSIALIISLSMIIYLNRENKSQLLLYISIANIIFLISSFWDIYRDKQRKIIFLLDKRTLSVIRKTFLFNDKVDHLDLSEFSKITSHNEKYSLFAGASGHNHTYYKNALSIISTKRKMKLLLIELAPIVVEKKPFSQDKMAENNAITKLRHELSLKLNLIDDGYEQTDTSFYLRILE